MTPVERFNKITGLQRLVGVQFAEHFSRELAERIQKEGDPLAYIAKNNLLVEFTPRPDKGDVEVNVNPCGHEGSGPFSKPLHAYFALYKPGATTTICRAKKDGIPVKDVVDGLDRVIVVPTFMLATDREAFSILVERMSGDNKRAAEMAGNQWLGDGEYTVYRHQLYLAGKRLSYIGITKRAWVSRWAEHCVSAMVDPRYRFHKALARTLNQPLYHWVIAHGLSFEQAMNLEEQLVAAESLHPRGLNMIPGGFAGIEYLSRAGFKDHVSPRQWEQRQQIIRMFSEMCDRAGRPNPLAAALWQDDDYAANIITANPNNFSKKQVELIRYLHSLGEDEETIAKKIDARKARVALLLNGKTYGRVH